MRRQFTPSLAKVFVEHGDEVLVGKSGSLLPPSCGNRIHRCISF